MDNNLFLKKYRPNKKLKDLDNVTKIEQMNRLNEKLKNKINRQNQLKAAMNDWINTRFNLK